MFTKDIIQLYREGIKRHANDNEVFYYNHYLVGKTSTTFKYIKLMYALIKKHK